MASNVELPDDENGEALRLMMAEGDDLSKPREIEFFFTFRLQEMAESFAKAIGSTSLEAEAEADMEKGNWVVTVTRFMTPTHADITELARFLARRAMLFGGKSDGWGCMQME